jgi:4-hydroxy-3-methylbut-2-enyl diphosphate reductase
VSETAAIVAALQHRFPELRAPRRDDICYASENRQQAVRLLARRVQQVLVIGSVNSSNTQRLVEIARSEGCAARRIDGEDEISCADLQGIATLGITAGASAPESLLQAVLARLTDWRAVTVSEMDGITETMAFALPRAVRRPASQATP